MKKITVLGSTGSIGQSTLKIAEHLADQIQVIGLAAGSNTTCLAHQIEKFRPEIVAVADPKKASELRSMAYLPPVKIVSGEEGVLEVAAYPQADFVVMAIVGMQALQPTLAAIEAGKPIGLASKEVLASAGELVTKKAKAKKVPLLPIDSEHSALFQCLEKESKENISKLILTASGGPFRQYSQDRLETVTVKEALNHPTWNMGAKVTIDSSTLMNKGLEMIEAAFLFDFPPEKIDVIVHPQSVVHSFVQCVDGSLLAQLSKPNMIYPIQYAITYPKRLPTPLPPFHLAELGSLEFYSPDHEKFPALNLAYSALETGQSYPCYLNAANETLVDRFLQEEISWGEILNKLDKLLASHTPQESDSLEALLEVDKQARKEAAQV